MNNKDKIQIITADITTLQVDIIVNAANNSLMGGGGVDGAIHRAAGVELKTYCAQFKGCETGDVRITPGFNLPAKYIIHAVGPVWNNGTRNEENLLTACYRKSMQLANEYHASSIAFPSISTGAYRYPFQKAGTIAIDTIYTFLQSSSSIEKVLLVTFSQKDLDQFQRIWNNYFADNAT
ncbi:MAG: O-acetyl-ADP-ribose deacetylase [Agriterribacter sp.]